MALKDRIRQKENWIIALAAVILLGICVGVFFDYYYDLNDDVLMKDILAGVYTGVPQGHNIQMHWPVSALISLFYRIARGVPWYGLFLCFCHLGCIFLILQRAVSLCGKLPGKLAAALIFGCFFGSFFLEHLVYAQYTVTCTLLGATAAFLFYTSKTESSPARFIRKNIPAVLLVWVAYLVRSEMLLLVLPMICVAGVAKWGSEKDAWEPGETRADGEMHQAGAKVLTKENAVKYFGVIGLILLGIFLGQIVHMLAYSSAEWKAFNEFFDNRTELYDFQKPPVYEENEEFYGRIGISESERILFDNYNFGLNDEVDEKMMGEIALYAGQLRSESTPFWENLVDKLKAYRYRFLHGFGAPGSDYPWNYLVIFGYLAVLLMSFPKRFWGAIWKLALLFFVRSGLWMYILLGERDPVRITHSLYLMEFCILAAMAFEQWEETARFMGKTGKKKISGILVLAVFGVYVLTVLPASARSVAVEQARREEVNAPYQELYTYLSGEERKGNFYFIDVFSSVSYSEKMFENVDNSMDNYDIMGGWACKSPLWKKKLAAFGIESMEQALKDREDVFFVRKVSEDMDWLEEYYQGHGTPVETSLVETIAGEFEIYAVHGLADQEVP